MAFPSDNFFVRILTTVGLLVMLLVLPALWYYQRMTGQRPDNWLPPIPGTPRTSRWQWALLAVGVTASGVFWYLMQIEQLHGGHHVWLVYAFAGATLFFEVVWLGLMADLWS